MKITIAKPQIPDILAAIESVKLLLAKETFLSNKQLTDITQEAVKGVQPSKAGVFYSSVFNAIIVLQKAGISQGFERDGCI